MRQPEFPFAKYRDWAPTPEHLPELDPQAVEVLCNWQITKYKRPVLDEITGDGYRFHPSPNGAHAYVTRASAKLFAGKTALGMGITDEDFEGRKERQPMHIAKATENTMALFWAISAMRQQYIEQAISDINIGFVPTGDVAVYAADAIADYGYCLRNPMDKDFSGRNYGPGLAQKIDSIAPGIGLQLEQFGLYAGANPSILMTDAGRAALVATECEQQLRIGEWYPRHKAIIDAFPDVTVSDDIVLQDLPLSVYIDMTKTLA